MNRALEDSLFLGRAHSLGHARQQVEVLSWGLLVNSLTLARHEGKVLLSGGVTPVAAPRIAPKMWATTSIHT